TLRCEAVPSGRQLQLEASISEEMLLRSLLVGDGARGRFEITLLVGQIEPTRKSPTRAGIAQFRAKARRRLRFGLPQEPKQAIDEDEQREAGECLFHDCVIRRQKRQRDISEGNRLSSQAL